MQPWKQFASWWDKRKREERFLLLGASICAIGLLWFQMAYTAMETEHTDMTNRIAITTSQIADEVNEQAILRGGLGGDPNAIALNKERELVTAHEDADRRLNDLYGQLIDPKQMSLMLTRILQRETALQLISLENQPSESLLSTTVQALEGATGAGTDIQVYRHGLKMVFKGDYLETMRYLQSLEQLDTSFFWDSIEYKVNEYPGGIITLEIYTLSTQQGWIGV